MRDWPNSPPPVLEVVPFPKFEGRGGSNDGRTELPKSAAADGGAPKGELVGLSPYCEKLLARRLSGVNGEPLPIGLESMMNLLAMVKSDAALSAGPTECSYQ